MYLKVLTEEGHTYFNLDHIVGFEVKNKICFLKDGMKQQAYNLIVVSKKEVTYLLADEAFLCESITMLARQNSDEGERLKLPWQE